jgi:hypothetical protein
MVHPVNGLRAVVIAPIGSLLINDDRNIRMIITDRLTVQIDQIPP